MKTLKTAIKSTLMIDSDEVGNANLINIFNENSLCIEIISHKHDFMKRIFDNHFDAILLSSDLPNNMSFKILDAVKGSFPWIIVIVLLKNPDYEKIFDFVRQGADDFVLKPFIWEDLEKVYKFYYF